MSLSRGTVDYRYTLPPSCGVYFLIPPRDKIVFLIVYIKPLSSKPPGNL